MSRGFASLPSSTLALPCVPLEGILQRWIGDGSSVVGDRRCGHDGDYFKDLLLLKTDGEE
jgi:hypothetical protein